MCAGFVAIDPVGYHCAFDAAVARSKPGDKMKSRDGWLRRAACRIAALCLWLGAAHAAEPEPHKLYRSFTLESAALGETRRINLYAPPGFDAKARRKYPVLYMPDGGVHEDFPHLSNAVDEAIAAGAIEPVWVVGIENTQRRRDMTGPTRIAEDRKIAPVVGGSAAFRAFIRDELMPRVEPELRGNGHRGVIGESLAGLFVVETFLLEPDLFDTYVAISPSLWWDDRGLLRSAAARLQAMPRRKAALLLYSANEDNIAPETRQLADALKAHAPRGLRWDYRPRPDLEHGNIYRGVEAETLRWALPARR